VVMTGGTSFAMAGFFECTSRVLQAFANGASSRLRTMFNGVARGFCTVFNRLPRFGGGFLYGLARLFDWTLIIGPQNERNAE
jgi:hypothetical protein